MNNGYNQNNNGRQMPRRNPPVQGQGGTAPRRDPHTVPGRGMADGSGQQLRTRNGGMPSRDSRVVQPQNGQVKNRTPLQNVQPRPRPQSHPQPRPQPQRQIPNNQNGVNHTDVPHVSGEYGGFGNGQTRSLASTRRKATREQMKVENRRRRRESVKLFFGRLTVYGIMLLIIGAIVAGVFFFFFYNTEDKSDTSVTYLVNYDGKKNSYDKTKIDGNVAYKNNILYVDFTDIANGCQMTIITDTGNVKFVLPDKGDTSDSAGTGHEEYVSFTDKSTDCVICGQTMRLGAPAVFENKKVWIPADFVKDYMNGITITCEENVVYVEREVVKEATADTDAVLAEISFKLKATTAPEVIEPEEDLPTTGGLPEFEFSTDLSEYEQYMNPGNNSEYLVLVNKTNSVDASHKPEDLVNVVDTRKDGRDTQKMREAAAKSLEAMFIELRAAGYKDVSVTSAYRSYEYQEQLYNGYISSEMSSDSSLTKEQAQAKVDTYSARPGTSEHQTGLCADLHNLTSADVSFANQEAYEWLSENAWKFGFILRFPEDKTEITGYSFEPWHYRFVGRNAAWQIYNGGLCLEEFLADKN